MSRAIQVDRPAGALVANCPARMAAVAKGHPPGAGHKLHTTPSLPLGPLKPTYLEVFMVHNLVFMVHNLGQNVMLIIN